MQNLIAKGAGVVVAIALFVGVAVPAANALTSSELVELLISIGVIPSENADAARDALGTTTTTTGSADYCTVAAESSFTTGKTGASVVALQDILIDEGYLTIPAGVSKGYFGSLTQEALASYQVNEMGVAGATGYYGPISQNHFSDMCQTVGDDDSDEDDSDEDDSVTLRGGAGDIDDVEFISSYNNEEVGEDEEDVVVAGYEVEAAEGSDIAIRAITLDFDMVTGAGDQDDDFEDYAEEVSVWFDGDEVARVDADEFDDDNSYRKSLTLDSGVVIEEEEEGDLLVAVSGIRNLDSDNEEIDWSVALDSIRFEDAQGAVITTSDAGDDMEVGREFSFETFSSAANAEMKVSLSDDDYVNESHVIEVDDNDETDGEEVLSFEVEVEGDSDLEIDDLVVDFTTDEDDLNDVISSAYLFMDGDEVGSENITSEDATDVPVTFDDLDLTLDAGDTYVFTVEVDFEEIDADFEEGTTLKAEITEDEIEDWDIEDEAGDDLADGDRTGSAIGEDHGLYSVGIMVDNVEVDREKTLSCDGTCGAGENEQAQFTYEFDVTAFGGDIYIDDVVETGAEDGHLYTLNGVGGTAAETISSTADDAGVSTWKIEEGETETFTITINYTADADEFVQIDLTDIQWNDEDVVEGGAGNEQYDFNMDIFESDPIFLNSEN